MLVINTQ